MKLRLWAAFLTTIIAGAGVGISAFRYARPDTVLPVSFSQALQNIAPMEPQLQRPYGMAPQAFAAYMRACEKANIHPWRIGQTIGDHPRSVGYHHQDGVLTSQGQKLPYTAAIDLGTSDLTDKQIWSFVEALSNEGFAAFYRHGPKWKNGEHIHAVYVLLPMKPQLRKQVREFVQGRRAQNKTPRWENQRRRLWRQWGYRM
jgi:hypothetical protein